MGEQAVAKLNEHMVKMGITPTYEWVHDKSNTGTHINKFVMRVKCPTTPNGPIYTAEGLGLSKKEAKQQAALIFMQRYLGQLNNNPPAVARNINTVFTCVVSVTENNRNSVLQSLCMKYDLPKPEFEEVSVTGPPHAKHFTFECRVASFSTEGKGSTKAEAKLQAITKMIQFLMQEVEIYEIFESPQSMVANNREIVCLNNNLKGSQLPVSIGIFGRRRSSSTFPDIFPARDRSSVVVCRVSKTTDTPSLSIGVLDIPKKDEDIVGSSDNSASNISLIDSDDDYQQKTVAMDKSKST